MAETIAGQRRKIGVRSALSSVFSRAIAARQKVGEWYRMAHTGIELAGSDRTHAYFVDILQRAAEILQPLVQEYRPRPPVQRNRRQKVKATSTRTTTNAFAGLSVEDSACPGDTQEDIGTASGPDFESGDPLESLPPVYPVEVQQDESEIEAEFFFAIQSFLTNVHELRDIVQEG
jgi:hypothetical protein